MATFYSWCSAGFYKVDLNSISITDFTFYTKEDSAFSYTAKSNVGMASTVTFSNNTIKKGDLATRNYYVLEVGNPATWGNATINGSGNTYCNIDPSAAYFTKVVSNTYAWDGDWLAGDISAKPTCL